MKILVPIVILAILVSCKPHNDNKEGQKILDEVMAIHDEVMPEISTIHKLKVKLRKLKDDSREVYVLIADLENSDEGMMSWMANFKSDKYADDNEQILYLRSEKAKIEYVSKQMKSAINNAQTFLSTYNND